VPAWNPKVGQYQLKENIDALGAGAASVTDEDAQVAAAGAKAPRGLPWESADVEDNAYADGMTADKVVETLRQVKDKPFFLAVGMRKPHLPFVAPKKYWDLYKREDIKLADNPYPPKDMPSVAPSDWGELRNYKSMPKQGPVTDDQARTLIHGYLAATSYMDAQLGKVIDELDRLGLSKNTVIVLWGDHGWKLGEHALWSKHTNFELDANAPMIMVAPGQKAPGKAAEGLTEFVDMYPTLCELCGLPQPGHLEGMSFAPLLDKPEREWKKAAFSQYPRRGGMGYSMKTKRYRFTQWFNGTGELIATELYDHQVDPKENVNVAGAAENAALVASLAVQLKAGYKNAKPA
jgi:arylsulfatase A-like enzyme